MKAAEEIAGDVAQDRGCDEDGADQDHGGQIGAIGDVTEGHEHADREQERVARQQREQATFGEDDQRHHGQHPGAGRFEDPNGVQEVREKHRCHGSGLQYL